MGGQNYELLYIFLTIDLNGSSNAVCVTNVCTSKNRENKQLFPEAFPLYFLHRKPIVTHCEKRSNLLLLYKFETFSLQFTYMKKTILYHVHDFMLVIMAIFIYFITLNF